MFRAQLPNAETLTLPSAATQRERGLKDGHRVKRESARLSDRQNNLSDLGVAKHVGVRVGETVERKCAVQHRPERT